MNFSNKKRACEALGNQNVFTATAVRTFLETSSYTNKNKWIGIIQKNGKLAYYATTLENDISRQQRAAYHMLSQIQVREMLPEIVSKTIRTYSKIQLLLHDGSIISERWKMEQRANELESQIIKSYKESSKDDLRYFLLTSILFGDKHHLFDQEASLKFTELCRYVE